MQNADQVRPEVTSATPASTLVTSYQAPQLTDLGTYEVVTLITSVVVNPAAVLEGEQP